MLLPHVINFYAVNISIHLYTLPYLSPSPKSRPSLPMDGGVLAQSRPIQMQIVYICINSCQRASRMFFFSISISFTIAAILFLHPPFAMTLLHSASTITFWTFLELAFFMLRLLARSIPLIKFFNRWNSS